MNFKKINHSFAVLFFSFFAGILFSCSGNSEKETVEIHITAPDQENSPSLSSFSSENISVKTFEVKDSTSGKSLGWGYDIYLDDRLTIHQPIIPAVEGNLHFNTEENARKTGTFAAEKIKHSGSMPTLSIQELDSLGVIK